MRGSAGNCNNNNNIGGMSRREIRDGYESCPVTREKHTQPSRYLSRAMLDSLLTGMTQLHRLPVRKWCSSSAATAPSHRKMRISRTGSRPGHPHHPEAMPKSCHPTSSYPANSSPSSCPAAPAAPAAARRASWRVPWTLATLIQVSGREESGRNGFLICVDQ